jgi:hypothetical protein
MIQRNDDPYKTIREFPVGLFWSREDDLSPEEAARQARELSMLPVRWTEYLLEEGELCITAVPFRHRN